MSLAHPAGNCRVKLCRSKIGKALVVATWNPAASSGYYIRQSAYYTRGREPRGLWYAPANDLSVKDGTTVDNAVFERLFAGRGDDGSPLLTNLGGKAERVPAFDITLSMPRSIALLWALADDATRLIIEAAQAKAVRETLRLLEREATFVRRGRGGSRIEPVALTAACFQHGESRPAEHADGRTFADPNLHTHCVVLNMATRADNTIGALHSVVMRNWKLSCGSWYHAVLASQLQAAGFTIDRSGRNGIFEIAGVPDDAIRFFSARRAEIEAELAEAGTSSADAVALAAAVARSTRAAKSVGDRSRDEVWREAAQAIGLDLSSVFQRQRERGAAIDHAAGERLLGERLADLPRALTDTRSILDRQEVVRVVAEAMVGTGLGADRATAAIAELLSEGRVVELGRDAIGLPRYSTPEMIRVEHDVAEIARRLIRHRSVGLDPADVRSRAETHGLSAEQTAAAFAATGPELLTVVQGAPGTGKTTTLRPIVEAWQAAGYQVVGAASAWKVANALRDDLGIEARATASWLARVGHGRPFLNETSVLIVDEAGLLGSRETHALLKAVEEAQARVVFAGDSGQLPSIQAGSGLKILGRVLEATNVTAIVRQRQAWARQAVMDFGYGDAAGALDGYAANGRLVEADGQRAAIRSVVDQVEVDLLGPMPGNALIIAKTNVETTAIGQEVRRHLRDHGMINGQDVVVDAVTPSGHRARLDVAVGDRLRFLVRHDAIGVVNGSTATVTRVAPLDKPTSAAGEASRHARIEAVIEGRCVSFDTRDLADAQGHARIGGAYASTIYGAQGMTVERAAVLLTPVFDRHEIYVAASRARDVTTLVVDSRALDRVIGAADTMSGSPHIVRTVTRENGTGKSVAVAAPTPALEGPPGLHALNAAERAGVILDGSNRSRERTAFLAAKLARANVKETTLDAMDPIGVERSPAASHRPHRQPERSTILGHRQPLDSTINSLKALADSESRSSMQRRELDHEL